MAQETSIFAAFVDKYFKGLVGKLTEYFNGKTNESPFLYQSMLSEEYTPDLTWNSSSLNHSIVAADVVAMDSAIPLKKRGTIRRASGDVAKLGIKYALKEKEISDINVMASKGQTEAEIAKRILANAPKAIKGIHTRIEIMFEQALSTGQMIIPSEDGEGIGVRADFGYDPENTFQATAAGWEDTEHALPITDIRQLFDRASANSDTITDVYLSEKAFSLARRTAEVKAAVAAANDQVIVDASNLPMPNRQKTLDALRDEFGAEFHVVNGSFLVEKRNGDTEVVKPWEQLNIAAVTSSVVGRIVHGTLAEETNKVPGVNYQKSGFILVSQYSHNEPSLEELTAAQAMAMPVIDGGSHVYLLQAESTAKVSVSPNSLTFGSGASTGKKVKVTAENAWEASIPSEVTWATITTTGDSVKVAVSANATGSSRTTTLTVTDTAGNSATVSILQSA